MVTDGTRIVTGDLTPDATGKYLQTGIHNGKPYYRREDGTYEIWWKDPANWYISTIKNGIPVSSWSRMDPAVDGEYVPVGAYLGVATVTEI